MDEGFIDELGSQNGMPNEPLGKMKVSRDSHFFGLAANSEYKGQIDAESRVEKSRERVRKHTQIRESDSVSIIGSRKASRKKDRKKRGKRGRAYLSRKLDSKGFISSLDLPGQPIKIKTININVSKQKIKMELSNGQTSVRDLEHKISLKAKSPKKHKTYSQKCKTVSSFPRILKGVNITDHNDSPGNFQINADLNSTILSKVTRNKQSLSSSE